MLLGDRQVLEGSQGGAVKALGFWVKCEQHCKYPRVPCKVLGGSGRTRSDLSRRTLMAAGGWAAETRSAGAKVSEVSR